LNYQVNHDLLNDRSGAFPSTIRLFDGFASFRSRFRREMDARLFVGNIQRTSEMARGGTRCAASDAVEHTAAMELQYGDAEKSIRTRRHA